MSSTKLSEPCPVAHFLAEGDKRSLIAAAQRIVHDRERAEDICQDVLLGFWSRPDAYDPARGTVLAYLTVVCRSRARDVVRADVARRRREALSLDRFPGAVVPDPADALPDEWLAVALRTLPVIEAEAIQLAFLSGLTYSEVAIHLGIPEGTAKSRIRRGLAHLHRRLPAGAEASA